MLIMIQEKCSQVAIDTRTATSRRREVRVDGAEMAVERIAVLLPFAIGRIIDRQVGADVVAPALTQQRTARDDIAQVAGRVHLVRITRDHALDLCMHVVETTAVVEVAAQPFDVAVVVEQDPIAVGDALLDDLLDFIGAARCDGVIPERALVATVVVERNRELFAPDF